MKLKVLISTSSFAQFDKTPLERLKQAGFEVMLNPFKRKLSKEELMKLLPGVQGLIAGLEMLDQEVMFNSQLKVISRCGVGVSNVDMEAAQKRGIIVAITPEATTQAVAELTIGCLLNVMRSVCVMNQSLHSGEWNKRIGFQVAGKTVLIVGLGRIGRRVAELLKPFEVKIIACDPLANENSCSFPLFKLQEALPLADVITLHASGEECILSHKEFELMKSGVFVLNAARGELIDENALIKALQDKKLGGVWLDVFDQEPYTGSLRNYPEVLLTPHAGSYTLEGRRRMEIEAVENLVAAFEKIQTRCQA